MKFSDSIRWGVRGIRQRKLRAALTILGILVGTAAVIALVSQTQGISVSIVGQIGKLGPNSIIIRPASATVILTQKEIGIIQQMPGVAYVIPVVMGTVKIYGAGSTRTFSLVGVDSAQFDLLVSGATISEGRKYQSTSYSEILVGHNVKLPQDLNAPLLSVGQSVTVESVGPNPTRKVVQVVGSLDTYGLSLFVSVDDGVFMSLSGASSYLGRTSYNALFVETVDAGSVDYVVNNLKAIYGTNLSAITVNQISQIVSTITGFLTILLGAIAGISLLVAGLGIMNIMFVSVIERTREIGVLKALGFKGRDILSMFLSEAAVLGIIGGTLGILSGTAISYVIPLFISGVGSDFGGQEAMDLGGGQGGAGFGSAAAGSFSYSPVISPEVVLVVFLFALTVSLLAGLYPARRASKMDPVTALRHE
jgi:putative ABC transport system permease protein